MADKASFCKTLEERHSNKISAAHKQEKSPSFRNVDADEYVYVGNHVSAYTY